MRVIVLGLLAALSVTGAARADDKSDIQALNDAVSVAAQRGGRRRDGGSLRS